MWWSSYEYFKRILYPYRIRKLNNSGDTYQRNYVSELVAASIATTITTFIFNPLEIVKTRMQTQHYNLPQADQKLINNTFSGLVGLVKEEGPKSLARGLVPRLISRLTNSLWLLSIVRIPLAALSAFLYEIILHASIKEPLKVSEVKESRKEI